MRRNVRSNATTPSPRRSLIDNDKLIQSPAEVTPFPKRDFPSPNRVWKFWPNRRPPTIHHHQLRCRDGLKKGPRPALHRRRIRLQSWRIYVSTKAPWTTPTPPTPHQTAQHVADKRGGAGRRGKVRPCYANTILCVCGFFFPKLVRQPRNVA